MRSTKRQAPSSREKSSSRFQELPTARESRANASPWERGIWSFSGAWNLVFGAAIRCLVLGALVTFAPGTLRAQSGIGDIVYTVGTTFQDSHGRDWAYLVWAGTAPGLISNRVFAVYAKPGDATNTAPYSRWSIVSLQTDARVIEPLIERAANLGDNPLNLQADLVQVFGSFMPSNAISRADQLSAVIRGSLSDPRYYANLLLLGRNHPGINMALGFADAQLIPAGRTTFEIRAFDPAASADLAVIGRVTVEAGNPTVLPPPGPPVLVPEPSAMGDLNIKLRWGTPDNVRRLGLMQFGYDLYRMNKAYADGKGWNTVTPPPLSALADLVATNPTVARRVNRVPIVPGKLFSIADAANVTPPTGDTNTFFIMDDDGRGKPGYTNVAGFTNGALYYYWVAARDILRRDGTLSFGLQATVCDRIPPLPPLGVRVLNEYFFDTNTLTSTQTLKVVWKQNLGTNDPVINYWIYRWTNVGEMNLNSGNPSNNLIAIVSQIPGATNNSYNDSGAGSPSSLSAYGETYWYSVRAGDNGACGQNLSGNGGPAFGVLRQRVGPGAGSGTIEINCLRPVVNFKGVSYLPLGNRSDPTNFDLYLNCRRLDSRFDWAEFIGIATYVNSSVVSNYFGRLFFLGSTAVSAWWTPPRYSNAAPIASLQVWCRAALSNGKVSLFTINSVNPPSTEVFADVEFDALVQSLRTIAGGPNTPEDCREHDPGGGGGGVYGTNNVCVHVSPSSRSKEYRIYRRVDNGPISLLCQGTVTNVASSVDCCDNATPLNGGSLCFYVQLLDENGNSSPLTALGCIDCAPITPLPIPVLSKITPTGDSSSPGMNLTWFCPPYGVERFEAYIGSLTTPPNTNQFQLSSLLSSTGAPPTTVITTNFGTNLPVAFYSFISPKVGPAFGNNGAVFQVPCNVEIGKPYIVQVRAKGKNNNAGGFSLVQTFRWSATNAPSPQVPWPARPLPGTNSTFAALAFYMSPSNPAPVLRWGAVPGNGVLVGYAALGNIEVNIAQGPPRIFAVYDPNTAVETNSAGASLFPCAMYRYQVPNTVFPKTSGDVIQVSPLMEQIAYQINAMPGSQTNTIIQDPFIGASATSDSSGNYIWLWLRDTQPQISGARYKYVLVHFNGVHEIDELVPSTEVDVP